MPPITLQSSPKGARLLARVMANTDCSKRAALLAEMLTQVPEALAVLEGRPAASERMYAAADAFTCRERG